MDSTLPMQGARVPSLGTKIPHAAQHGQKNRVKGAHERNSDHQSQDQAGSKGRKRGTELQYWEKTGGSRFYKV